MLVGWALVDKEGNVLQRWGDMFGQEQGVPDKIHLPNGDIIHCPLPGEIQEWRLVPRYLEKGAPKEVFDGEKVIASREE